MPRSSDERTKVLYTRAEPALVRALDREQERRRLSEPGRTVSRSDVIRSILWGALVPQPGDVETPQHEAGRVRG